MAERRLSVARRPEQMRASRDDLYEFIVGDAHHHAATAAGMLRYWGDRDGNEDLTKLGDRLADLCRRARKITGNERPGDPVG